MRILWTELNSNITLRSPCPAYRWHTRLVGSPWNLYKCHIFSLTNLRVGLGKLHNEEPHYLYSLRNIIIMMKSRRMQWKIHRVWMAEINTYTNLVGNPLTKRPFRWTDISVDGRIILKSILTGAWEWGLGFIWFRIGTRGRCLWTW
jgi:hypothetical protein